MMMWKIVETPKASVLYIYIYIYIDEVKITKYTLKVWNFTPLQLTFSFSVLAMVKQT